LLDGKQSARKRLMESTLPEQIESERLILRVARPGDGAMFKIM
jgi:hypothetical protein